MATFAHAHAMKERIAASLLKHPKVYGVGVGHRDPKDPSQGAAVVIYANARSASSLGIARALQLALKRRKVAVPIRVVKSGKIRSHANYARRIRPVPAGYSIGTIAGSGTAGLIVTDAPSGTQWYIFSDNHVLTNPINARNRAETLQPGGADGGRPVVDRVGYLSRLALLKKNAPNFIDAALSTPVRNSILSPRYAAVGIIPGHVTSYRVGARFKKVGRTTGLRYGTVTSVNTDILVDYGGSLGTLKFRNQTIVQGRNPVSLPGDSGSVWLRSADNFAAAVNYAGSTDGRISVAFPIDWALRRFQVNVAKPNSTGRVRIVPVRNSSYARRLTAKELASIQVVQIRQKGARPRPAK
ncbi:S1 family peptidase [Alicyclobacillus tolerans]|uniref:S1 family peptidase n=1 Tax=Alicyclobacillus tolerans TaxID=90970 RepID=UPI001F187042|nr:S1 family peptidase [Alicyclobacillus tolerans]MCF8567179.1 S1 family peptidase [Alicyclobacillus tolerans]